MCDFAADAQAAEQDAGTRR